MKKSMTVLIALALLALGGAVWAADTTTVAVSANVVGTCRFNNPGTITFTLDPGIGGDVVGFVTQPQFWCTRNASYTITDDLGQHEAGPGGPFRMQHATIPTEFIPYSFTYTATGTGNGQTNPITMNIASTVLSASYTSAAAGSYTDTVRLTINP